MKKFFVKHCQVEGEILKGDLFEVTGGIGSLPGIYVSDGKTAKNDWNKKLQLCLCDRDMKPGDKVKLKGSNAIRTVGRVDEETNSLWIKNDDIPSGEYVVTLSNYYPLKDKILGKISSHAMWVKEGDEFDEDEFLLYLDSVDTMGSLTHDVGPFRHNVTMSFVGKNYSKVTVRIKCSNCQTFH